MLHHARTFRVAVGSLFLWISAIPAAYGIDIGEVPPGLGGSSDVAGSVVDIVIKILSYMALIATIVIIIAGVRMVISMGDEGAVSGAKKTLLWALIGLILILLAGAIVSVIANIF